MAFRRHPGKNSFSKNTYRLVATVLVCFSLYIDRGLCTEIKILPETDSLYSKLGSNVTVTCSVLELGGKSVRWSHKTKQIAIDAPENTVVFVDPADRLKYVIEGGDRDGGNFSFTLLNFAEVDVGPVTCEVSEVDPAGIALDVFVEPESVTLSVDTQHTILSWTDAFKEVRVDIQTPGTLSCSVTKARPRPAISWTINGLDPDNLNISETSEVREGLVNVTSHLRMPPNFVAVFTNAATTAPATLPGSMDDDTSSSDQPTTSKIDVAGNGENSALTIVATCEVRVGDRRYVDSVAIEFANLNSAGGRISSFNFVIAAFIVSVVGCW